MGELDGRLFERRGDHLVPADLAAQEMVHAIPEGKQVLIEKHSPRSPRNHSHFFAILHMACEHLDAYQDEDVLLDVIKLAVGHSRPIMKANGEWITIPKSINFGSMSEDEFRRFKNRALHVLGQLLGTDPVTLLEQVDRRNQRNYRR